MKKKYNHCRRNGNIFFAYNEWGWIFPSTLFIIMKVMEKCSNSVPPTNDKIKTVLIQTSK